MPAVTPADLAVLPRLAEPDAAAEERETLRVVTGISTLEGEGFPVRRPFPGKLHLSESDPFLLLDHMGAIEYAPGEPKGTAWHPHRGFETVTYIIDGAFAHQDSTGGGGLISNGDTQWMTAGSGLLHIETPPEELVVRGGLFHGVQIWVNLPRSLKWTPPRYQDIRGSAVSLLSSADGGVLVRVIAGDLGGCAGPGITWTPIVLAHATLQPGAQLRTPWRSDFNAMVYALSGSGSTGPDRAPLREGQLALLGEGEVVSVRADDRMQGPGQTLEVLLLGGQPIREPIAHYGPFVMNTHEEIAQTLADFAAGRLGQVPVTHLSS
ncbi:MAG TPA: pirin family protein [Actinomycetes bacterium]|nr:pirin family protein [Actinomycetes bacterium]